MTRFNGLSVIPRPDIVPDNLPINQASKQAYLFVNKNDRLPKKPLA